LADRPRLCRQEAPYFAATALLDQLVMPSPHNLVGLQASLVAARMRSPGLYAAASVMPASAGLDVQLAELELRSLRMAVEAI
jgi:hypothetical protein